MSGAKKKTTAEELIESLLKDMGGPDSLSSSDEEIVLVDESSASLEGLVLNEEADAGFLLSTDQAEYSSHTEIEFESTRRGNTPTENILSFSIDDEQNNLGGHNLSGHNLADAMGALQAQAVAENKDKAVNFEDLSPPLVDNATVVADVKNENIKTEFFEQPNNNQTSSDHTKSAQSSDGDSDKTVAVAGYQVRPDSNYEDRVKVSVGQNRMSSGYQAWNNSGGTDSNLAQADNLRMAQEKILDLEQENEKLRSQNEELMAASEIIKERSDLLSAQMMEYKNDRDGLKDSFKSEVVLLKNHLAKKDTELQKIQFKAEELDSRLKFDMKKIRVRERELENRLELIRSEKNAVVKNKDEQILDLRRKMDILQMEVESYRQKCVELNKSIESSQESFKRTTRALRLAMANLELQDENKVILKKVD